MSWAILPVYKLFVIDGYSQKVHCSNGHVVDRDTFQDRLSAANPRWKEYMDELEATGRRPRTNPDGDVSIKFSYHAHGG